MGTVIKERVKQFTQSKQLSIKEFEEICGLSNGYINSMRIGFGSKKLNNVLTAFPDLNREWLLYGEGEMLKPKASTINQHGQNNIVGDGNQITNQPTPANKDDEAPPEQKSVPERPLVPIDVATRPNFDVYEYVKNTFIPNTTYIGINVLQNYDLCFQANTDALAPTIMKNDILALSAQPKGTFIVNGLPYVIDTYKVGFLLRYAYEIGDKVELRVSNEDSHLTTTTIDKSEIIRMYRIIGLLRLNV